jgi:hypothetical protein
MGAGVDFFTTQKAKYQQVIDENQPTVEAAQNKVAIANEAIGLLAQSSLTPADVDKLLSLYADCS